MKKVIVMGATGMIGGLVLKECLNNQEIKELVSIGRRPTGVQHEKLTEIIHYDFLGYSNIERHFENVEIKQL